MYEIAQMPLSCVESNRKGLVENGKVIKGRNLLRILVTGSRGLIGKEVTAFLKKKHTVEEFDLQLGHDFGCEGLVKELFKEKAGALVNLFALNDHVKEEGKRDTLFDIPLCSLTDYFNTNLTMLFSVCREYARNNEMGSIVNFSSHYGVVSPNPKMYGGNHKHIGYCVSKAGVISMTKYLAVHLAPKIRVNCIAPGGVLNEQGECFISEYSNRNPMNRMMNNGELNRAVEFLCREGSSYMTGSVLTIDGGWSAC